MCETLYYEVGHLDEDVVYLNTIQEDPFVRRWLGMLRRCYSGVSLKDSPCYLNVYVSEPWLTFSNFKSWMIKREWKDMHLDKDLLGDGTLYSPETCCLIPPQINYFMVESKSKRGDCPSGVSYRKDRGYYEAYCNNPFESKRVRLGSFDNPYEAHVKHLTQKLHFCRQLSHLIKDPSVRKSFIKRYEDKLEAAVKLEKDVCG